MLTEKVLQSFVIVALVSTLASAYSLDEARRLQEAGESSAALAEINGLLDSDATDAEKAEALDLLGSIAVDKGYLSMARQAWARLVEEYPDSAATADAETKLQLVSALLKTESSSEVSPATSLPSAPSESPAERSPPTPAPVSQLVAAAPTEPSPPPAAADKTASAPAPTPAAKAMPGQVLVAARGKPYDAVVLASERIVEFLRQQGVDAASATQGIPVVEDSKMVLPLLLQKGQADGAGSVLLLTADYVSMQKMALDCYLPSGERLWKIKTSGGTGWKGRSYTKSGITEELYGRFEEKLGEKVGQPGLPVTLD